MKYAILVGCNYATTSSALQGCINDVLNMRQYLYTQTKGYDDRNVTLLTDSAELTPLESMPTRERILQVIDDTVAKLVPGDSLFFHMSSHGGQQACTDATESDGRDETVYGCDLRPITDNELKDHLVNRMPMGTSLYVVIDACHSGTSIDLPWMYVVGRPCKRESQDCERSANCVCLSACRDNQYAADSVDQQSQPAGALTAALLEVLYANHTGLLWRDLVAMLRHLLKTRGYDQIPQLCMGCKGLEKHVVKF